MANEVTEQWLGCQIVEQLRTELSRNKANCYEVDAIGAGEIPITSGAEFILQVCFGNAEAANPDEQSIEYCPVTVDVQVGIVVSIQLDQHGKVTTLLTDENRGLRALARKVKKALIGFDPGGKLAGLMVWRSTDPPAYSDRQKVGWRTLHFSATYDECLE